MNLKGHYSDRDYLLMENHLENYCNCLLKNDNDFGKGSSNENNVDLSESRFILKMDPKRCGHKKINST